MKTSKNPAKSSQAFMQSVIELFRSGLKRKLAIFAYHFLVARKRCVFLDAAWHLKEVENGDVERRKELSKQNERVTKVADR